MNGFGIRRREIMQALGLASVVLALALASQAAASKDSTPGVPIVSTGASNPVGSTSATLQGSIDPRTLPTTYFFQYGPTTAYGSQTTPATLASTGTTKIKVSQLVTGIVLGEHYRLVATNADGMKAGHDRVLSVKRKGALKSGFTLASAFAPTPLGSTFILSGTLTGPGNGNRAIVLQASPYPYRAPFADVGHPIATSATGGFAFRVSSLFTSTKFRVVTASAPALSSPIVTELVTVRVLLKARVSHGLVRLYGTVTPAEVGAHVFFQLEKARGEEEETPGGVDKPVKVEKPAKVEKPGKGGKGGKHEKAERPPAYLTRFSTIVKRGTKSLSRFSAVVKIRDAGSYRAYVQIPAGALVSGHSQTIALRAAPGSARKRKRTQ